MFSRIRKEFCASMIASTLIAISLSLPVSAAPLRSMDDFGLFTKWIGLLERALETFTFFDRQEAPAKAGSTYDPTGRFTDSELLGIPPGDDPASVGSQYDPTGLD